MKLKARLKLGGSRDGIKTKMLKLASYRAQRARNRAGYTVKKGSWNFGMVIC